MLLEMHAHTNRHSKCSVIGPVTLVRKVIAKGLQGLIITEHHYLWSAEEIEKLRVEAGVEKWFAIFSGQEVQTDIGHVLVYGADCSITKPLKLKELRKQFPKAALVWAHPFRKGAQASKEILCSPLLDGIEIFSLNQTEKENYEGLKSWHELKFTALSGSDTHTEENAGVLPAQFDHDINSLSGVVKEIKKGRVRPFFKEVPKSGSDLTVTEITLGTKGGDEQRQRIIVKSISSPQKWNKAKESAALLQKIYNSGFGGPFFRVPRIIDINDKEKTLIEEGQRGKNLYDELLSVGPAAGIRYVESTAKWLAKFHSLNVSEQRASDSFQREKKKLNSYANNFRNTGNSTRKQALELLEYVEKTEISFGRGFVLNHGDFHPKNIIIGHDRSDDPGTLFISVIDFANAFSFLPAFDAGYFLAQFASQFAAFPEIIKNYNDKIFLNAYFNGSNIPAGFLKQVNLFKIRANLSIANYFIKVGKGESPGLRALISQSNSIMQELTR